MSWTQLQPDNPALVNRALQAQEFYLNLAEFSSPAYRAVEPSATVPRRVASDLQTLDPEHFSIATSLVLAKFVQLERWELVAFLTAITSAALNNRTMHTGFAEAVSLGSQKEIAVDLSPNFNALEPIASHLQALEGDNPNLREATLEIGALLSNRDRADSDETFLLTQLTEAIVNNDYKSALEALSEGEEQLSNDTYFLMCEAVARLINFDLSSNSGGEKLPFSSLEPAQLAKAVTLLFRLNQTEIANKLVQHLEEQDFASESWAEISRSLDASVAALLAIALNREEDIFAVNSEHILPRAQSNDRSASH